MPEPAPLKPLKKKKKPARIGTSTANTAELRIGNERIHSEVSLGTVTKEEDKNLISFYVEMSNHAYIDTGIIPLDGTGLLSYRHALNSTQIVYQQKPGIYQISWGERESTKDKPVYMLAQPWRVWIADLLDGELLGVRHFYSPVPVQTPDQQLFHVNLPNLNCLGYNGTSVGWICLYHKHNWKGLTIGEKINRLIELAGGFESYNDANMRRTDGPRFYAKKNKPKYVYDPVAWQKKTEQEGWEWTLNPDLWIPVLVKGIDEQSGHVDGGIPLTLDMAMKGNYHAYYTDKEQPKPFNGLGRVDVWAPDAGRIETAFRTAFTSAKKDFTGGAEVQQDAAEFLTNPDLIIKGYCPGCKGTITNKIFETGDCHQDFSGLWCPTCVAKLFVKCHSCGELLHFDSVAFWPPDDAYYCGTCKQIVTCGTCGTAHDNYQAIVSDMFCVTCVGEGEHTECEICARKVFTQTVTEIAANNENDELHTYKVCDVCAQQLTVCGCNYLRTSQAIDTTDQNGVACCNGCYKTDEDGYLTYKNPNALPTGLVYINKKAKK